MPLDSEILCGIYPFCKKIYIDSEIYKYQVENCKIVCSISKVGNKLNSCQKLKCLIKLCYIYTRCYKICIMRYI